MIAVIILQVQPELSWHVLGSRSHSSLCAFETDTRMCSDKTTAAMNWIAFFSSYLASQQLLGIPAGLGISQAIDEHKLCLIPC